VSAVAQEDDRRDDQPTDVLSLAGGDHRPQDDEPTFEEIDDDTDAIIIAPARSPAAEAHGSPTAECGSGGVSQALQPSRMVNLTYPKPDRSNQRPKFAKTDADDTLDIGWAEGTFSDGRPFRIECWAQDQVTYLQCFFSSVGLEKLDRSELQQFLERERVIRFVSDKRFASGRLTSDASNNAMWEVNVVIGDEDELYAESDVPLKPYPSEGPEGILMGGEGSASHPA
jgi:hypothetical protein